ncbi:hypothetical protein GCM10011290_18220 [Vogesella alkaliphila]|uniref:Lipoprotein n=2 Tax=Vogesella alkaliphila TaxID=1193621 RepID=A0ABQ2YP75_9NEIS|nr:hypothetical protein GCM10011290_18220 [Vogesella alkaliphila]
MTGPITNLRAGTRDVTKPGASPTLAAVSQRNPIMYLRSLLLAALLPALTGCAVITVADAAVTVVATTVKVGATVVGAAVDVTAAGVRAATRDDEPEQAKQASEAACPPAGPCP